MARQRRIVTTSENKADKGTNSSSSNGSDSTSNKVKGQNGILMYWKHVIGFICFAIAACVGYMGYLETRVNTPFDDKKVHLENMYICCEYTVHSVFLCTFSSRQLHLSLSKCL